MRIITVKSLTEEIDFFKPKSFNFFLENGLNKTSNPKTTIALLLKNKLKHNTIIRSFSFSNDNNVLNNDIPFYHPFAPDGFSLFCSQYEYNKILTYITTEEYKNKIILKKQQSEEGYKLKTEPEPNKKEFLCQVCKTRFDNYLEHIKSKLHNKNKSSYINSYKRLKLTFKRIVEDNKKNKILNESNNLDNMKTQKNKKKEYKNFHKDNTKKYINNELFSSNNENKICFRDEFQNKLQNKLNSNEQDKEKKENKEISIKEILDILDTIEEKKDFFPIKIKPNKRKKNNNKYFFSYNLNNDLKKVTGKIAFFNDLYK